MASAEADTPAAFDAAQMLGYLAEVDELLDLIEQAMPEQHRNPAAAYFAADRLDNAYRSRRGPRRSDRGLSL